ncbi:DUF222 domain-containing protein [Propioniciclava soli]|uniref:DUF222 domain-containing protein n=1 Tax=Propioniciclava soli TaxID=2775081 RepID=UPI001E4149E2|nr:DUF222 domain-containing protein [Propioniciclava soli]
MNAPVLRSVADAAAALAHAQAQVRAGEVATCLAIAALCDLHRVDETVLVAGAERWVPGGADGTPRIGEFVAAEIAGLVGVSVGSAFGQIARVLNLRHRHPTLWALVLQGDARPHEAFRVADAAADAGLDAAACARFDAMCAHALVLQPWPRIKGRVDQWILRADPAQAARRERAAAKRRHVSVGTIEAGHVALWGQLDAADGIALDDALTRIAGTLPGDDLNHRRADALGVLARGVLGQDPLPPRKADLVVRLDAADIAEGGVAAVERWGHVLLPRLTRILAGCTVRVRPVVVPGDGAVDSYQVPEAMRLTLATRNPVDVFPWGTRRADACQVDHTVPYEAGRPGQTHLANLGPLSSYTHRVKTHGGWKLDQPRPGEYRWRSPLGYEYAVTAAGTIRIGRPPPAQVEWWYRESPFEDPPESPSNLVSASTDARDLTSAQAIVSPLGPPMNGATGSVSAPPGAVKSDAPSPQIPLPLGG